MIYITPEKKAINDQIMGFDTNRPQLIEHDITYTSVDESNTSTIIEYFGMGYIFLLNYYRCQISETKTNDFAAIIAKNSDGIPCIFLEFATNPPEPMPILDGENGEMFVNYATFTADKTEIGRFILTFNE